MTEIQALSCEADDDRNIEGERTNLTQSSTEELKPNGSRVQPEQFVQDARDLSPTSIGIDVWCRGTLEAHSMREA